MIINLTNEWWEVVEEGRKALCAANQVGKAVENPYDPNDTRYDYWELGFMAAEHGWDIEL